MSKRSPWLAVSLVVALVAVGAAAAFAAVSADSGSPAPQPVHSDVCAGTNNDCTALERERAATSTTEDIFGGAKTVNLNADQAMAKVRQDVSEFPQIDRIESKQTTWLSFTTAAKDPSLGAQVSGDRSVIVVAVSGKVVPPFARGETYEWGVLIYDAATATPISMRAGNGTWPDFFDNIPGASTKG
jgi:hypothetical protein